MVSLVELVEMGLPDRSLAYCGFIKLSYILNILPGFEYHSILQTFSNCLQYSLSKLNIYVEISFSCFLHEVAGDV